MPTGTVNYVSRHAIDPFADELEVALVSLCGRVPLAKPLPPRHFAYILGKSGLGTLEFQNLPLALGFRQWGGVVPEDPALEEFLEGRGWEATRHSNQRARVFQPPLQKCTKCPLFLQCKLATD